MIYHHLSQFIGNAAIAAIAGIPMVRIPALVFCGSRRRRISSPLSRSHKSGILPLPTTKFDAKMI
jgi:hypothetical protein